MQSLLRNLSIAPKIFSAVALLLATSVIVAMLAFWNFATMDAATREVAASATRVEAGGRATANLLSYARAVEFLPIEMPVSQRETFENSLNDEYRRFLVQVTQLEQTSRTSVGREDAEKMRRLAAQHLAEASKIRTLSRDGAYDDAGKIAFTTAPVISQISEVLRGLEQRASIRQQDAVKAAASAYSQATWMMMAALAIGGSLSLALTAWLVIGFITRPLGAMTSAMLKVADGDVTVTVPALGQQDEIGKLAGALETFKANLIESRRLEAEQATERAAKERRANVVAVAVSEFEKSVSEIVSTVTSASAELEAAAGTLTSTAEATQAKSGMVAAASEQASGNVQAVAAATDEMTSSIHEIARQVMHSTEKANGAVAEAKATDAKVSALLDAAGRIGEVVKLITAVAEQTNLLALNATIEAARAGEAGKGFAVVASEVKALAGQTAKATDAIGAEIAAIQTATREAAASIRSIGTTIVEVADTATAIAAAVEEQGAATQEIARNVQEAAKGTVEVASSIVEVNQGAVETGSASAQVLSASQELSQQGSRLKTQVDTFLATVRAA
ncbi:MAG: methyl-accepting chemotaxis protein [Phreatobacter sp.]|uniref:methyl-accepting chemotaxis protein n=1 Tax=Phreatobacter sp. TaxID=1966341 RepID=UPI002736E8A0|nr:methyl-accepting chemotaxis protein [Phreatobacter sp.]MDP2803817.1 methyl-accepting chemotaxis protein [Phreatobacter sp.]